MVSFVMQLSIVPNDSDRPQPLTVYECAALPPVKEWKRGRCAENFGESAWSTLSRVQKQVVYGVFFGMCGWRPSGPTEWDTMYKPDSLTRKDFWCSGVALFLGRGVQQDVSRAVAFWQKAILSFEPNAYYFLGLCHK